MIKVLKNGINYSGWKSLNVSRSLTNLCASFNLTSSVEYLQNYPIKASDEIQIFINDTKFFTGYVEIIDKEISAASNDISISGRDKTSDLVDSTLEGNLTFSKGQGFSVILKKMIDEIGSDIEIIENVNAGTTTEKIEVGVAENCLAKLREIGMKKQIFFVSNEDGNIEIIRGSSSGIPNILLLEKDNIQSNIKNASVSWNLSTRFRNYVVKSQTNSSTENKGIANDNDIRAGRKLTILADSSLTIEECRNLAVFEKNNRKAMSFNYNCEVADFTYDGTNIYELNKIIKVIDKVNDINAKLLISGLEFNVDNLNGLTTRFSLVDPLAYGITFTEDARITARTTKGSNYVD